MQQKYKNPQELLNLITPELISIYEIDITSIKVDLEEEGMLSPVVLSKDGIPLDGYRRLYAAVNLGWIEVPYLETNLETTVDNRVTLNQSREKTWKDERSDFKISFKTFATKQGQRDPAVKYDRYEQIRLRTNSRFKDPKTLKDVEWILDNESDTLEMSKWLFYYRSDVSSVRAFMELPNKDKYPELVKKVMEFTLTPSAALKQVELSVSKSVDNSFVIPVSKNLKPEFHFGENEEVLSTLKEDEIKAIFIEADTFKTHLPKKDGSKGSVEQSVTDYATQLGIKIRNYTNSRLSKSGSVFVFCKESYDNGCARQIPNNLITLISKESGMTYKQTIYIAHDEFKNSTKNDNRLGDSITHLLWFIKDKTMSNMNAPKVILSGSELKIADENSFAYKLCSNFLDNQTYVDLVKSNNPNEIVKILKDDKSNQTLKNLSALLPIKLSTKEGDLVVDLSMKNDVAGLATLLNRRYIGVSSKKQVVANSNASMTALTTAFKKELVKSLVSPKASESKNVGNTKRRTNNPV